MHTSEIIIQQTKQWLQDVVIGCNFCPFALPVVKKDEVHYRVCDTTETAPALEALLEEMKRLDDTEDIATTLLIFPEGFKRFDLYLKLVEWAEALLEQEEYDGVYQVASFHPLYCFAGADLDDPANYTNRSPYPMLHLLREESIEAALDSFPDPDSIPERNIQFAREKGLAYMQLLRNACLGGS
jgi:hypothetical protein